MHVDVIVKTGLQVQVTSPQAGPSYGWVDTNYYPRNNPSGYATGVDGSLFVRHTESGVLLARGETGNFATISQLGNVVYTSGNQTISGTTSFSGQVNLLNGVDANAIDFTGLIPPWQEGRIFYDTVSHSLSYYNDSSDVVVNLGQEQMVRVRNGESSTISNGSVVRISGAQGNHPLAYLADASAWSGMADTTLGVATHNISADGYITTFGLVHDIDTQGIPAGSRIFLTTGGSFSATEPAAPDHRVRVGYVLYEHQNQGIIFVDIHVGQCLRETHDVSIQNPVSGQLLVYNASNYLWENKTVSLSASGYITTGQLVKFSTPLNSGVESQAVNYPLLLATKPTAVVCEIENNIDNLMYSHVLTGVSNSGFWICFSDNLSSSGYLLYTTITI